MWSKRSFKKNLAKSESGEAPIELAELNVSPTNQL